jgi:hypothetical protein
MDPHVGEGLRNFEVYLSNRPDPVKLQAQSVRVYPVANPIPVVDDDGEESIKPRPSP